MAIDEKDVSTGGMHPEHPASIGNLKQARRPGFGLGLLKGMRVTLKHLFKHNTVIEYPDEKQDLPARTRGVIALKEENCTVCMLCSRECPDWCIYIDSHKEELPPKREGGRKRKRNVLDRFAIDYALCMYCGICVEVCPYDALFWSREFEYAEYDIRELTHEKERLSDWMATVLPPPPLEQGAQMPGEPDFAPTAAPAQTVAATGARPATTTSSAVQARPEQAEDAPKAGSVTTTPERTVDTVPDDKDKGTESPPEQPAKMAGETVTEGAPAAPKAETVSTEDKVDPKREMVTPPSAEPSPAPTGAAADLTDVEKSRYQAEPGPNVEVPHEEPQPVALERLEDPEEVYRSVLEEQRAKGSSPQVAEARAKVARVKAERGIRRAGTPARDRLGDRAEPQRPTPPVEGGAPKAEEPQPPQGPVAPEGGEG
ncbi:MAG TPA: 4Fe-4S binding protein [Actinomycetota bacterium]|nr:4Fe-4S binding protein [Actinomycetota bacterium]